MDILDSLAELVDVVASFHFVESLAALDEVRQRLILANIQHDVDILSVLEVAVEAHDVLIVERSMNFDLTGQFLTSLGPCQVGLGDHLERPSR